MLNKETLRLAKEYKANQIYYELEAAQLRAIWDIAPLSAFFIIVLLAGSSALNWRSFHFLLTIGERISGEVAGWISVPLAMGLGWALFQQSFRKALGQIKAEETRLTFKNIFLTWLHDRSIAIAVVMVFGIFGALLFLWGETYKNEMEVAYAGEDINRIEAELEDLKIRYENDVAGLERDIEFYRNRDLVKREVVPRQNKIETLTTRYEEKKAQLDNRLEKAREGKSRFRPTSFLSDVIGGDFLRRVIVILFCAILFSSTVDLAQYSITTISASRAFAAAWVDPERLDVLKIYDIFIKDGVSGNNATENATPNATQNATLVQQSEPAENNGNGSLRKNGATTLSDLQERMLRYIQNEIDKGAEIGEINKTALAAACNVDRTTIYRNWEDVLRHVTAKNGKHEEVAA